MRLTSFSRSPPGLTFTGPAGGTYQVERSTGLRSWTAVAEPVVTVNASHSIALSIADMAGPESFWRVRRTR